MYTLYTFPMACSVAVEITLTQHDVPHILNTVARGSARKIDSPGFEAVNPNRKVPTLVLPSGETLTEMVGVQAYLGETFAPVDAATQRRRIEWLSVLATELHQGVLAPLFDKAAPAAAIEDATERLLPPLLAHLEAHLTHRDTLLGGPPDGADAYLVWALVLLRFARPESVATPALTRFRRQMLQHAFVSAPLAASRERSSP